MNDKSLPKWKIKTGNWNGNSEPSQRAVPRNSAIVTLCNNYSSTYNAAEIRREFGLFKVGQLKTGQRRIAKKTIWRQNECKWVTWTFQIEWPNRAIFPFTAPTFSLLVVWQTSHHHHTILVGCACRGLQLNPALCLLYKESVHNRGVWRWLWRQHEWQMAVAVSAMNPAWINCSPAVHKKSGHVPASMYDLLSYKPIYTSVRPSCWHEPDPSSWYLSP